MSGRAVLFGVGDIAPRRQQPKDMFARLDGRLHGADLVFGQLEAPLSDRGAPMPHVRLAMRCEPAAASAIREAGFDVVSFAGNHCLDWGLDAFADTLRHVGEAGLALCGAGATEAASRRPAVLEAGGLKVAFLAYSSILPAGYAADGGCGGSAPMRAFTHYEQIETDQPGTPARVHTFPHREDLRRLCEDVRTAKAACSVVIVSLHWGVHFVPAEIADYQRDVAKAAVQAGADAILGHHPHILKGIELIGGRPVFYSLGNFAIEQPTAFIEGLVQTRGFKEISALNADFDPTRSYIAPKDTQLSMIAKLTLTRDGVADTRFIPVMIDDDARPAALAGTDPGFRRVTDYVADITRSQGLGSDFVVDGDEIIVRGEAT
jgi:poly-gamma-glutamate synthesis protein (capsule biosynthesis protein)